MRAPVLAAAVVLSLAAAGCGAREELAGDPAVHARIRATTSCEELKLMQDRAEAAFRQAMAQGSAQDAEQKAQFAYFTAA